MRRRFFVERFDAESAALRGDAAEHLGRVLRAEIGQQYELSDGNRVWLARVERLALTKRGQSSIEFKLIEPIPARPSSLQISLLISVVKFDRFEWCLEKATEFGVSEIVPLAAARADKPLIAAAQKRTERWRKIVFESAQQSRQLRPPAIQEPLKPIAAFAKCNAQHKLVLSERSGAPPLRRAVNGFDSGIAEKTPTALPQRAALAIGPEGGWTDDEIASAHTSGFAEASLGENILRTETAVIAALAVLRFACEIA